MEKREANPIQCRAKSKLSGEQCRSWAVRGRKVCRMHGAFGGIKTVEGRVRQIAASTKHGYYAKQAIARRREVSELINSSRKILYEVP